VADQVQIKLMHYCASQKGARTYLPASFNQVASPRKCRTADRSVRPPLPEHEQRKIRQGQEEHRAAEQSDDGKSQPGDLALQVLEIVGRGTHGDTDQDAGTPMLWISWIMEIFRAR
jgi:hypothetical protein